MKNFSIETEAGIALIRIAVAERRINTLTDEMLGELESIIEHIRTDDGIRGAILTSGRPNGFCAGADLHEMIRYAGVRPSDLGTQQAVFEKLFRASLVARRLESCGKPVVAALNGTALGGGFELALACHHRIAGDSPTLKFGLPEVTLGLMPGGGGTQRALRLLGIGKTMPLLLDGKSMSARETLALGLIDEVVSPGEEIGAARAWILAGGDPCARWDRPDFELPGGDPYSAMGNAGFIASNAAVTGRSFGNSIAHTNVAKAVYEGALVPIDVALKIEAKYFVDTLQSTQALSMVRSLFYSYPALRKGTERPTSELAPIRKVVVIGAGMMGGGIAFVSAKAGINTILIDVSQEAATAGKEHSRKLLDKRVDRASESREEARQILARITPTSDYAAVSGADIVIETVFEDATIKGAATRRAASFLDAATMFASNTSTLLISRLAQSYPHPSRFLGLHFHSPVHQMELVEVVVGAETEPAAISLALDYVRLIGKTAIVVQDAPFFYSSRVFDTYIREGMEMLAEGIAPAMIDRVGRMTGMPRGPLELTDDVAIDLVDRIAQQRHATLPTAEKRRRSDEVVDTMVGAGRLGRKNGRGFYDYPPNSPKRLWPGLSAHWPVTTSRSSPELIARLKRRLLHRQALEAARTILEGVVCDPRHADVGALLGWGFPKWTGGPIGLIEQIGLARFVDECDILAETCGARFKAPPELRQMAEDGRNFYTGFRLAATLRPS